MGQIPHVPAVPHLLAAAVLFGGCAAASTPPPAAACPLGHAAMERATLYFGRDARDHGEVSDAAWQDFVDRVVTPRFPDGLSVLAAQGQWRGRDGAIVRERSTLLQVFAPRSSETDARLAAIADTYKRWFHQEAVLQERSPTCVAF